MPKNIYKEKLEQMNINGFEQMKKISEELEKEVRKLQIENASLKERLRLVEIAARGE